MTAASAPGPREVVAKAMHSVFCWHDRRHPCAPEPTEYTAADAVLAALDLPAMLAHERAEGACEALEMAANEIRELAATQADDAPFTLPVSQYLELLAGTKHQHTWELTMSHHHGAVVVAEVHECECGAGRWTGYDINTQRCPDCTAAARAEAPNNQEPDPRGGIDLTDTEHADFLRAARGEDPT